MRTHNWQLGKVTMQIFYLGQPPVLDVENDGSRLGAGYAVPQVFLRAG